MSKTTSAGTAVSGGARPDDIEPSSPATDIARRVANDIPHGRRDRDYRQRRCGHDEPACAWSER